MRGSTALYRCSGPLHTTDGSTDQLAICDHAAQQIDVTSLKPCDREHCGCPGPGLGSPGERGGEGGKPGSARLHPARRRGLYSPRIVGDLLGLVIGHGSLSRRQESQSFWCVNPRAFFAPITSQRTLDVNVPKPFAHIIHGKAPWDMRGVTQCFSMSRQSASSAPDDTAGDS